MQDDDDQYEVISEGNVTGAVLNLYKKRDSLFRVSVMAHVERNFTYREYVWYFENKDGHFIQFGTHDPEYTDSDENYVKSLANLSSLHIKNVLPFWMDLLQRNQLLSLYNAIAPYALWVFTDLPCFRTARGFYVYRYWDIDHDEKRAKLYWTQLMHE